MNADLTAPHVDVYKVSAIPDVPIEFMRREDDPRSWYAHTQQTGEPYWNGYVWGTAPHQDGECEAHRPTREAP